MKSFTFTILTGMQNNFTIRTLEEWLPVADKPLVISGPCSAETRDQVLKTARELTKIPQVKVFRAGIWKPRTRPSSFEGVGNEALKWLQEVKEETGLLTAVEVAKPDHVENALKHGVDILWFGARTVVNPFNVQELCEALKGLDVPVLVKNPLNPDVKLWLGAIERLYRTGISKIVAVHRGFYFYRHALYRNQPMWEVPIELQRLAPGLPIVCDPSHICGRRDLLQGVSQKALDLGMSGLMIESHFDPLHALTDANQQVTPQQLAGLISRLSVRNISGTPEFESLLEQLRQEIDKIDAELIDILARRMKIVEDIGQYKRDNNITVLQIRRWADMISERLDVGSKLGLDKEFLLKLLQMVHKESIRKQEEIMGLKEEEE